MAKKKTAKKGIRRPKRAKKRVKKVVANKPGSKARSAKKSAKTSSDFPDFATIRGVSTFDMDDSEILVCATHDAVAEALKKHKKLKTTIRNAIGKSATITGASYLVFQLTGHSWVTVTEFTRGERRPEQASSPQNDAKTLSKSLSTRALYFGNSDTSGVTEYDLYESGKLIEHFRVFDGVDFNSKCRDIDPPEDGPEIYDFVNDAVAELDAFVTGWSWSCFHGWRYQAGDKVNLDFGGLPKEIFAGFHFVS